MKVSKAIEICLNYYQDYLNQTPYLLILKSFIMIEITGLL
jgi:hypothetical protein